MKISLSVSALSTLLLTYVNSTVFDPTALQRKDALIYTLQNPRRDDRRIIDETVEMLVYAGFTITYTNPSYVPTLGTRIERILQKRQSEEEEEAEEEGTEEAEREETVEEEVVVEEEAVETVETVVNDTPPSISQLLVGKTIMVVPGSNENAWEFYNTFYESDIGAIREFIQTGGRYYGICMGAYMVGFNYMDLGDGLGPYNPRVGGEVTSVDPITWGSDKRLMFMEYPPEFGSLQNSEYVTVYSYFENGSAQAFNKKSGRGYVGLIAGHPEASLTWNEMTEKSLAYDLGVQQIEHLVSDDPLRGPVSAGFVESAPTLWISMIIFSL